MTLTVGSLFSGVGGLDLGLERAGMQVRFQVEIDPYCRRVLAKHWPNVERFEDVRLVGAHNLARVDLLCGGFPCQGVSSCNHRGRGLDDPRSGLWLRKDNGRLRAERDRLRAVVADCADIFEDHAVDDAVEFATKALGGERPTSPLREERDRLRSALEDANKVLSNFRADSRARDAMERIERVLKPAATVPRNEGEWNA